MVSWQQRIWHGGVEKETERLAGVFPFRHAVGVRDVAELREKPHVMRLPVSDHPLALPHQYLGRAPRQVLRVRKHRQRP